MTSLRYPLQVYNGRLVTTDDYPTIVGDRILAAVQTLWEERVMQPTFGIFDPTFSNVEDLATVLTDVRRSVALALATNPDVTFDVLGSINDDGSVYILIRYQAPDVPLSTVETTLG